MTTDLLAALERLNATPLDEITADDAAEVVVELAPATGAVESVPVAAFTSAI